MTELEWNTQSFVFVNKNAAIEKCRNLNRKLYSRIYSNFCIVESAGGYTVMSVAEALENGLSPVIYG